MLMVVVAVYKTAQLRTLRSSSVQESVLEDYARTGNEAFTTSAKQKGLLLEEEEEEEKDATTTARNTTTTTDVNNGRGGGGGVLHNIPGIHPQKISPEYLWTVLVHHAINLTTMMMMASNNKNDDNGNPRRPASSSSSDLIAMEVGMHNAKSCLQAAQAGLTVHCLEPSPTSFARVQTQVASALREQDNKNDAQKTIRGSVHLYNKAASNTSEGTLDFHSSGSTGDHVGDFDMWNMTRTNATMTKRQKNDKMAKGDIVQVPQIRLDDIVVQGTTPLRNDDDDNGVFLLKVDTQGFEPFVFAGLSESLRQQKIKFILTEFWPRGMDLHAGQENACVAAELLSKLHQAGYILYPLSVAAHPKAPRGYPKMADQRPLHDFRAHCQWYFDLETLMPSQNYKAGYWSDILAVSSHAFPDQAQLMTKLAEWVNILRCEIRPNQRLCRKKKQ